MFSRPTTASIVTSPAAFSLPVAAVVLDALFAPYPRGFRPLLHKSSSGISAFFSVSPVLIDMTAGPPHFSFRAFGASPIFPPPLGGGSQPQGMRSPRVMRTHLRVHPRVVYTTTLRISIGLRRYSPPRLHRHASYVVHVQLDNVLPAASF